MTVNLTEFENIKHTEDQREFWLARELMPLLGYKNWRDFNNAVDKSKVACSESGNNSNEHFEDALKTIVMPRNATKQVTDYKLSRYACYLIAMNGDSRKPEIALAQTYFATQTRKQELFQESIDNARRLENRAKLTDSRKRLREEVYTRGIDDSHKFAGLEDNINLGLYTKRTKQVKKMKGIPEKEPLDDYTTSVELLAKSLSMEMTKINVNNKDLVGIKPIYTEGKENAGEVRKSLKKRGILPEKFPAQKNIKTLGSGENGSKEKLV